MKPHLHAAALPPRRDAARILVVDDSQVMRLMLTRVLHRAGFQVDVAENGRAALDRALAAPPDLVLMDVTMPVMNGWEATHRLRTHPRLSHVPVVMLSCNTQPSDLQYAYACGAHSYLTKPIAPAHLVDHVRAVLRDRPQQAPVRASLAECCVLVVDDGGPLRDRIGQALAGLGCRILGAASGAEAFWLAREHVPDVILMDLALPQSRDAARHVRGLDALRHIPILALSTERVPEAPEQALRAGAREYVVDPFTDHRLLQRVVSYLVDRILDTRPAPAAAARPTPVAA